MLNLFNCSSLDTVVIICPREKKLYFLSNWAYHVFIAEKSSRMVPALGWMFCIVAEITVFKLCLVKRFAKKWESLAESAGVDGQLWTLE